MTVQESVREPVYADATLSDFASVLLGTKHGSRAQQVRGDKTVNISSSSYASSANHNLSSLLSQIQDDRPAYAGTAKRDSFFGRTNNVDVNHITPQETELQGSNVIPDSGDETGQVAGSNMSISTKKVDIGIWFLILLMLSVAVLSVAMLIRLESRTSGIEESLNSYDASLQDSMETMTHNEELSQRIRNTSATLQSIQDDLQKIKKGYEALDGKYTESMANSDISQQGSMDVIKDSVGDLKQEIMALKSELQEVRNKSIAIAGDDKTAVDTVADNGLTVHLASLTNKDKAEQVVEQLNEENLYPFIQTVVVKGKQMYRLSVSGFINREQAEAFVREAGVKYGMKDGWIRKS